MKGHALHHIAAALGIATEDLRFIRFLATDTRKIRQPENTLFFALPGINRKGFDFIRDAWNQGVRAFVISEPEPVPAWGTEATWLIVPDVREALQKLAAWHRSNLTPEVVGITGSNGKTTVKDWLWQVVSPDFQVCRSPKSYNSQVGVPLSVWELDTSDEIGIFEAGISEPGEMARLEKIIRPNGGIFTNIGSAHDSFFDNRLAKAQEKAKLFQETQWLIYAADYPEIQAAVDGLRTRKITFSLKGNDADWQISRIENQVRAVSQEEEVLIPWHLPDEASVENMVSVWLAAEQLGVSRTVIFERLPFLWPLEQRLQMVKGIYDSMLVNDVYSADEESLRIAVSSLQRVAGGREKLLIVSDLSQTAKLPEVLYPEIAGLIRNAGINRVIGIGPELLKFAGLFPENSVFYADTPDFIQHLNPADFARKLVLVKGARKFRFEQIIQQLEERTHQTILEINLDSLVHNLQYFRRKVPQGTKWMAMVKASSYGTGGFEIANMLQYFKVDYLAVAIADEGVELRKNGIRIPILVLNPVLERLDRFMEYNLEMEVFSKESLQKVLDYRDQHQVCPGVHLKIDTGMRRLGFDWNQLGELLAILKAHPALPVRSVFSHLAASDDPSQSDFTWLQISRFTEAAAAIEQVLGYPVIKHILNSSGISAYPEAAMDMVRLGVGLYGVGRNADEQADLLPVAKLTTLVSQVKKVHPGETIGYGRTYTADSEMEIAILPLGYADGFRRELSNGKGKVFIHGKSCPVVGRVCMDMTMVDVTGLQVKTGDEAEIFGNYQSLGEYARSLHTIAYEVLTSLPTRVKRIYNWDRD